MLPPISLATIEFTAALIDGHKQYFRLQDSGASASAVGNRLTSTFPAALCAMVALYTVSRSACGASGGVLIDETGFAPSALTIRQGDEVLWHNGGAVTRTATEISREWDSRSSRPAARPATRPGAPEGHGARSDAVPVNAAASRHRLCENQPDQAATSQITAIPEIDEKRLATGFRSATRQR